MPNETKKVYNRIKGILKGNGILHCCKDNFMDHEDNQGNKWTINDNVNGIPKVEESLDYIVSVFPNVVTNFVGSYRKHVELLFNCVGPGGLVILYVPHIHYAPNHTNATIPYDVIMDIKHISKYNFEIVDFQTYGYDGSFDLIDKDTTEYAFQMVLRKSNQAFNQKKLDDDPGQLVEL